MDDILFESGAELVVVTVSALGSIAFTLAGVAAESAGIQRLLAGDVVFGLWEVWMGGLALVTGIYLLGYCNVWQRLRARRAGTP
jgi:hypothetical protein